MSRPTFNNLSHRRNKDLPEIPKSINTTPGTVHLRRTATGTGQSAKKPTPTVVLAKDIRPRWERCLEGEDQAFDEVVDHLFTHTTPTQAQPQDPLMSPERRKRWAMFSPSPASDGAYIGGKYVDLSGSPVQRGHTTATATAAKRAPPTRANTVPIVSRPQPLIRRPLNTKGANEQKQAQSPERKPGSRVEERMRVRAERQRNSEDAAPVNRPSHSRSNTVPQAQAQAQAQAQSCQGHAHIYAPGSKQHLLALAARAQRTPPAQSVQTKPVRSPVARSPVTPPVVHWRSVTKPQTVASKSKEAFLRSEMERKPSGIFLSVDSDWDPAEGIATVSLLTPPVVATPDRSHRRPYVASRGAQAARRER